MKFRRTSQILVITLYVKLQKKTLKWFLDRLISLLFRPDEEFSFYICKALADMLWRFRMEVNMFSEMRNPKLSKQTQDTYKKTIQYVYEKNILGGIACILNYEKEKTGLQNNKKNEKEMEKQKHSLPFLNLETESIPKNKKNTIGVRKRSLTQNCTMCQGQRSGADISDKTSIEDQVHRILVEILTHVKATKDTLANFQGYSLEMAKRVVNKEIDDLKRRQESISIHVQRNKSLKQILLEMGQSSNDTPVTPAITDIVHQKIISPSSNKRIKQM